MYLLDTNVISQFTKRQPDQGVVDFFEKIKNHQSELYLSVLTIGEINSGISKLTHYRDHQQAEKLQRWLTQLKSEYTNRILAIDSDICTLWGAMLAATDNTNAVDKLIAATALNYGFTLVTRNVAHMAGTGAQCVNPFMSR